MQKEGKVEKMALTVQTWQLLGAQAFHNGSEKNDQRFCLKSNWSQIEKGETDHN